MNINDWGKDRKMCEEMMEKKDNEIKKLKEEKIDYIAKKEAEAYVLRRENNQLKKQLEEDDLLFQDVNQ